MSGRSFARNGLNGVGNEDANIRREWRVGCEARGTQQEELNFKGEHEYSCSAEV
jgi:hypothetical protein